MIRFKAPKKVGLKRGRTVKVKVRVRNSGGAFNGKLVARSSSGQVKVRRKTTLRVPAHRTRMVTLKVRATRKARGRAKLTVRVGARKAVTRLRVRR